MSSVSFRNFSSFVHKVHSRGNATHLIKTLSPGDDTSEVYIDMNSSDVFQFIDVYLESVKQQRSLDMMHRPKISLLSSFDTNVPFIVYIKLKHTEDLKDESYDNLEEFIARAMADFIKNNINLPSISYAIRLTLFTFLLFMSDEGPNSHTEIYIVFPALRLYVDDAIDKLNKLLKFLRTKIDREFSTGDEIRFDNLHESFLDVNVYSRMCPMYGSWSEDYTFRFVDPKIYTIKESNDGRNRMIVTELVEDSHDNRSIDEHIMNTSSGYINFTKVDAPLIEMEKLYDKYNHEYLYFIAMSTNYNNSYVLPSSVAAKSKEVSEVYEPKTDKEIFNDLMAIMTKRSGMLDRENVWLDIGNISNTLFGPTNGLNIWKDFTSRMSTKFTEDDCDERVHYLTNRVIGVKTIAHHVKMRFKAKYAEWHDRWVKSALLKMIYFNDHEIAESFYRMFWLKYVCSSSSSRDGWYVFKSPIWEKMNGTSQIFKDLNKEFAERLREHISELRQRSAKEMADSSIKTSLDHKIQSFEKICGNIGNSRCASSVIKMMYMFEEDIEGKFDHNANLFPFLDCVAECIKNKVYMRPGYPEDYILTTAPHPYRDFTWECKPVVMLMDYYQKVFHYEDLIMHVRKIHASRLMSGNRDKKFVFEMGVTGTSKSLFKKLRDEAYGHGAKKFSFTFDKSIMTSKKQRGGPSPELDQATGSRLGFFCEFNVNATIVADGLVKTFSGGDDYFTRSCNKNGGMRKSTFMMFFQANNPPSMNCFDDAIKDRLLYVPFLSKWRDEAPEDPEEQRRTRTYKKDKSFDDEVKVMAPAFLWLMIQDFPRYYDEGLEMPRICKDYVQKYWSDNDYYMKFIEERMICTNDQKDIIDLGTVYSAFCEWFRYNYPTQNDIDRKTFTYSMKDEEKFGDFYDEKLSIWSGWKMKDDGFVVVNSSGGSNGPGGSIPQNDSSHSDLIGMPMSSF